LDSSPIAFSFSIFCPNEVLARINNKNKMEGFINILKAQK
jgi:hypothetical protein